jgi:hypothetical protein
MVLLVVVVLPLPLLLQPKANEAAIAHVMIATLMGGKIRRAAIDGQARGVYRQARCVESPLPEPWCFA